jgi:hypothetical protein
MTNHEKQADEILVEFELISPIRIQFNSFGTSVLYKVHILKFLNISITRECKKDIGLQFSLQHREDFSVYIYIRTITLMWLFM